MNPNFPTVLAYHRISRIPLPAGTWVSPKNLAGQMDMLWEAGFSIADPQQWDPSNISEVLLTFDDGTVDLVEMGGVLARRGLKGMVFVPSNFLGLPNHWEWSIPGRRTHHLNSQQLSMLVDLGWEIGLHGASHGDLTRMNPDQLQEEIIGGRYALEKALGIKVTMFSYPFGFCNDAVKKFLLEAGFAAAFIMAKKDQNVSDPFAIPRRPVYCIDTPGDVLAKVADPMGATFAGRWQFFKERGAHGVGRLTAAWKK